MKGAFGLGLALGLAVAGAGLELARPVLFLSEPLVLWTLPGEEPPRVSFGGTPLPVERWERTPDGDRIRWEARLPPSPPGVWLACAGSACYAFLRVPEEMGIVEVRAPPGTPLSLAGAARVADRGGWAWFAVPPGEWELRGELAGGPSRHRVEVRAGERVGVTLILAEVEPSARVVLPGHRLTLSVRAVAPRDLSTLGAEFALPEGWEASPTPGTYEPIRAGELAVRAWIVSVPAGAILGEHAVGVRLPDLGLEIKATVTVAIRLPPREVVCHWDVTANRLDLTLPCFLTYERLLWAATFVGRELPHTGRPFSQPELLELAREWGKP
ncbi:MAG: NEW3 domain-containing protein [Candidatus Bipolaricaulota bacterium]|nr:NEW3 domain-containing protein [Candidatus Bipolaricaulota bacterium]